MSYILIKIFEGFCNVLFLCSCLPHKPRNRLLMFFCQDLGNLVFSSPEVICSNTRSGSMSYVLQDRILTATGTDAESAEAQPRSDNKCWMLGRVMRIGCEFHTFLRNINFHRHSSRRMSLRRRLFYGKSQRVSTIGMTRCLGLVVQQKGGKAEESGGEIERDVQSNTCKILHQWLRVPLERRSRPIKGEIRIDGTTGYLFYSIAST